MSKKQNNPNYNNWKPTVLYPNAPVNQNYIFPVKTICPSQGKRSYIVTYINDQPHYILNQGSPYIVTQPYIMKPPQNVVHHHYIPKQSQVPNQNFQPMPYQQPQYVQPQHKQPQKQQPYNVQQKPQQPYHVQPQQQPHNIPPKPQYRQPTSNPQKQTNGQNIVQNQVPEGINNPPQQQNIKNISQEEYLKQVEALKIAYGYVSTAEHDIANEPYLNIGKKDIPEVPPHHNDSTALERLLENRVGSVLSYIEVAKSYQKLSWPIWELSLCDSKHKIFKTVCSSGRREREIPEVLDCGWEIIGTSQSYGSNALISEPYIQNKKLENLLLSEDFDINEIRETAIEDGIPNDLRAIVWQILIGYVPCDVQKRGETLQAKRTSYFSLLEKYMTQPLTPLQRDYFNVISLDAPRTRSAGFENLYQLSCVRKSLERILYIWACENNNIGYFQGLNELVSVLLTVFLESALSTFGDINAVFNGDNCCDIRYIEEALITVEPDVFYCIERIIKMISAYHPIKEGELYSQTLCAHFEELIKKINFPLWKHLSSQEITFLQFSFRWFLCFFTRELTLNSLVCLWDTLVASETGFSHFVIYFAAVYLLQHSKELMSLTEEDLYMYFFTAIPSNNLSHRQVKELIIEAFEIEKDNKLNIKKPFSLW